MLKGIWWGILEDKLEQDFFRVDVVARGEYASTLQEAIFFFTDKDTGLAEKVIRVCKSAFNNLCKGEKSHIVESLQKEVDTMRKTREELREMLNPIKLYRMILRTRCELCPA